MKGENHLAAERVFHAAALGRFQNGLYRQAACRRHDTFTATGRCPCEQTSTEGNKMSKSEMILGVDKLAAIEHSLRDRYYHTTDRAARARIAKVLDRASATVSMYTAMYYMFNDD
jgi:hypothetical protein